MGWPNFAGFLWSDVWSPLADPPASGHSPRLGFYSYGDGPKLVIAIPLGVAFTPCRRSCATNRPEGPPTVAGGPGRQSRP